ncbi:F-box domain containing protein [Pandoravirus japonicus]|uniref:F-box domain containing protein n=1 Tax=Pandoravirus japonicus TaxID=2823154 RepID=A0A811BMY4_9VIRU|nr:F-box domain containing protein [Pandoravirus japonicus]
MKRSRTDRVDLCMPEDADAPSAATRPTAKRPRGGADDNDCAQGDGDGRSEQSSPSHQSDRFEYLPEEILAVLLNGLPDQNRFYLEPRWRAVAAMVCRRWRRVVSSPSLAAVALLDRARPHRASPAAWSRGRILCASTLCDAVASLPSDMGAADRWLALVPDRCSTWPEQRASDTMRDDLILGPLAAVMASSNLAAMRDAWSRHLTDPHTVVKSIVGDWFDADERCGAHFALGVGQNLASAMVHAACRAARPSAVLWLLGRCGTALTLDVPARRAMLSALAEACGDEGVRATAFDAVVGLGRFPWREALQACLEARSHAASDLLAEYLFALIDRGSIVVAARGRRRARGHSTEARAADFVAWDRWATAWCREAIARDRPRVAAAAVARWGVPTLAPTARPFAKIVGRGDDDDHRNDALDWRPDTDLMDCIDDESLAKDDDDHRPAPSQAGFWEAALTSAVAGGATTSIAWLLAEGTWPSREVADTPAAALDILLRAVCAKPTQVAWPCALDVLSGALTLVGACAIARPPVRLMRAAMQACARGVAGDRAAHALFVVCLGLWPDRVAASGGNVGDALCGLLHAQAWSAVDAAVDALDRAPSGLFGGVDLWHIGALGHHGLLGSRTAAASFRAPRGLAFVALRAGALAPEAISVDVAEATARRHPLAPAVGRWRRWCRPRPVAANRCAIRLAAEAPDGAWTTLERAGLLRDHPTPCDDAFCDATHTPGRVYA